MKAKNWLWFQSFGNAAALQIHCLSDLIVTAIVHCRDNIGGLKARIKASICLSMYSLSISSYWLRQRCICRNNPQYKARPTRLQEEMGQQLAVVVVAMAVVSMLSPQRRQ